MYIFLRYKWEFPRGSEEHKSRVNFSLLTWVNIPYHLRIKEIMEHLEKCLETSRIFLKNILKKNDLKMPWNILMRLEEKILKNVWKYIETSLKTCWRKMSWNHLGMFWNVLKNILKKNVLIRIPCLTSGHVLLRNNKKKLWWKNQTLLHYSQSTRTSITYHAPISFRKHFLSRNMQLRLALGK